MELETNPMSEASEIVYEAAPVFRAEHGENRLTRVVEQQSVGDSLGATFLGR